MPASTSAEKVALIESEGGTSRLVDDPSAIYAEAAELARAVDGHYLDQFTYAERATDWRGNNNIAESIYAQLSCERHPIPSWIVVGAGTGGTSATIGRFVRYRRLSTNLCVVDPENSAFFPSWLADDPEYLTGIGSRIEGIGRPRVEPSFVPGIVDRMIRVPDAASVAAARFMYARTGRRTGPSTGTNLWGSLQLACGMRARGQSGSIVTLLCDGGERYLKSIYSDDWVAAHGLDLDPPTRVLEQVMSTGVWIEDG